MPDLGVMLLKARDAAIFSGNNGNSGNGSEKCKFPNTLAVPTTVPTADTPMGTVGTDQAVVPTVPSNIVAVGTEVKIQIDQQNQILKEHVPTVPTVPSENSNSSGLFEHADLNRCFVCGERETFDEVFIAVLTSRPGEPHWIHHTCHKEYIRRCAERRQA